MKALIGLLMLLAVSAARGATWYVSNGAVNGAYIVGSDANAGTSPATALLTISFAIATKAANGDTIIVNPSGTPYSENSGSNYLLIGKTVTIETDPAFLTAGKATITSPGAGAETILPNANSIVLQDLIIDNAAANRYAVVLASVSPFTMTRCDFKNITSNSAVRVGNAVAYTLTLDKCTMLASNGNTYSGSYLVVLGNSVADTLTITGCSVSTGNLVYVNSPGSTVSIGASADGTRTTCLNSFQAVYNTAANATIAIRDTDYTYTDPTSSTYLYTDTAATSGTSLTVSRCGLVVTSDATALIKYGINILGGVTSGSIDHNAFQSTVAGKFFGVHVTSAACTNLDVNGNYCNLTGMTTGYDPIYLGAVGSGCQVRNNQITSDGYTHMIDVGGDGQTQAAANLAATTGDQNLGDTSGDTYIAQQYAYPASSVVFGEKYLQCFKLPIKAVGTPTGTITASLYSDSAGAPGTSQLVSNYTVQCSSLTTSYQQFEFWSDARFSHAFSTNYWIVLHFTGAVDGANYAAIQKNAAGTTLQTSAAGTSWAAGTGSLLYYVGVVNLECVNPKVTGNIIAATNTTAATHCIIVNGADGCTIANNLLTGGAIGCVTKLVDGSVTPALVYDNLASFSSSGGQPVLLEKGSRSVQIYQNTAVTTAGTNYPLSLIDSSFAVFTAVPIYNGTPSRSATVKNNLFSQLANNYLVRIGTSDKDYCVTGAALDHNLLYDPLSATLAEINLGTAGTFTNYATLGLYSAGTSQEIHSVSADPLLTQDSAPLAAPDFIPLSTSPAIGSGANLTASVPNDWYGIAFSVVATVGAINPLRRVSAGARTPIN